MGNSAKRNIATLIPYKQKDGNFYFFLQLRDKHAKRLPGRYGFFGGGLEEGENPENCMLREIKEELDFEPNSFEFLGTFEAPTHINNVFILEVGDDFELKIKVQEGQHGRFFSSEEARRETKLNEWDKTIIEKTSQRLKM